MFLSLSLSLPSSLKINKNISLGEDLKNNNKKIPLVADPFGEQDRSSGVAAERDQRGDSRPEMTMPCLVSWRRNGFERC